MRRLALPFLTAMLLAGPAAAETFGDWQVSCDAGRCQAVGLADRPDAKGYLTIRRQPGAAPAQITVLVVDPEGTIADRPYILIADGKPLGGPGATVTFSAPEEEGGLVQATLSSDATTRLTRALRTRHTLQLRAADGSMAANVSLAGAVASWLYMDDRLARGEAGAASAT
ncbi:DUF1176 domain-containing protein [Labrys neptuniae]